MGVLVSPNSPVVKLVLGTEAFLYNTSIVLVTPVMLLVLLFIVIPVCLLFKCYCKNWIPKMKKSHIVSLSIIRHIFFVLPVDDSSGVPRFKFFGFIAPVYYGYLLFYFFLMIAFNCIYVFLVASFLPLMEHTSCDSQGMVPESNATDCLLLSINFVKGFSETISVFLGLVVIYTYNLMILLKFSGGKQSFGNLCNKQSKQRLARVIVTVIAQVIFVFVIKVLFVVYYIIIHFDGSFSFNVFDDEGAYALSLVIDTITFGMLTPWWSFERGQARERRNEDSLIENQ